jgi:hypothetical protein
MNKRYEEIKQLCIFLISDYRDLLNSIQTYTQQLPSIKTKYTEYKYIRRYRILNGKILFGLSHV